MLTMKVLPSSESAFDAQRAAVNFDQLVHESQADPGSFVSSAAGVGNAMEAIEEMWDFFRRNSDSGIANPKFGALLDLARG